MQITVGQAQLAFSAASVILAGVLAWVTYLYYTETQNHTEEMQKTRELEVNPVLKPTVEWQHGLYLFFAFENIGKGAAKDIEAEWGFKCLDHREDWKAPLVTAGQRFSFKLPFEDADTFYTKEGLEEELGENDSYLVFEATYFDVLDKEHQIYEEISILPSLATRKDKEMVNQDNLQKIRQDTKKFRKDFRKVQRDFRKVRKIMEANQTEND